MTEIIKRKEKIFKIKKEIRMLKCQNVIKKFEPLFKKRRKNNKLNSGQKNEILLPPKLNFQEEYVNDKKLIQIMNKKLLEKKNQREMKILMK
jgi:hypothetical protein